MSRQGKVSCPPGQRPAPRPRPPPAVTPRIKQIQCSLVSPTFRSDGRRRGCGDGGLTETRDRRGQGTDGDRGPHRAATPRGPGHDPAPPGRPCPSTGQGERRQQPQFPGWVRGVSPRCPLPGKFSNLPQAAAALGAIVAGSWEPSHGRPRARSPVPGLGVMETGLVRWIRPRDPPWGSVPVQPGDTVPSGRPRPPPAPHRGPARSSPFISAHLHSSSLFYF